jgi:hypothetical protein
MTSAYFAFYCIFPAYSTYFSAYFRAYCCIFLAYSTRNSCIRGPITHFYSVSTLCSFRPCRSSCNLPTPCLALVSTCPATCHPMQSSPRTAILPIKALSHCSIQPICHRLHLNQSSLPRLPARLGHWHGHQ